MELLDIQRGGVGVPWGLEAAGREALPPTHSFLPAL